VFLSAVSLLTVAFATAAGAPTVKDRPTSDPDLVGEWSLTAFTQGGAPVRGGSPVTQVEFAADGTLLSRNRNWVIVTTDRYTADRGQTPRALDLQAADGRVAVSRGAYVFDGDTLTVVYVTDPAAARPAKVEAPAGSTVYQAVYVRRKKD
jgi:uncharacterized protein (TIGR03067 family)